MACLEILHYMILIILLSINGIWSRQTNTTDQYCDERVGICILLGAVQDSFFILIPSGLQISSDSNVRIIMMKGWRRNSRSILHGPLQRSQVKFLRGMATNTKDNMRNSIKACHISLYILLLLFLFFFKDTSYKYPRWTRQKMSYLKLRQFGSAFLRKRKWGSL